MAVVERIWGRVGPRPLPSCLSIPFFLKKRNCNNCHRVEYLIYSKALNMAGPRHPTCHHPPCAAIDWRAQRELVESRVTLPEPQQARSSGVGACAPLPARSPPQKQRARCPRGILGRIGDDQIMPRPICRPPPCAAVDRPGAERARRPLLCHAPSNPGLRLSKALSVGRCRWSSGLGGLLDQKGHKRLGRVDNMIERMCGAVVGDPRKNAIGIDNMKRVAGRVAIRHRTTQKPENPSALIYPSD